jgi:hypothetical protein
MSPLACVDLLSTSVDTLSSCLSVCTLRGLHEGGHFGGVS